MKIEMNTIYHLPTQAHEQNFLKEADKLGFKWASTQTRADVESHWGSYEEEYVIYTRDGFLRYGSKQFYEANPNNKDNVIEWKINFTKADMQIGQIYRTRDGSVFEWETIDALTYNDNLFNIMLKTHETMLDIIEVYPMETTPIWKRPEPKYRVKTELTKEQAEKLGLEFCEVVE